LFDRHSAALKEQYPEMTFECQPYPLAGGRALLVQGLTAFFVSGFAAAILSAVSPDYSLPQMIGVPSQAFYVASIAAFFLSSMLGKSGAYELYLDGKKIFSKLESGKVPQPKDLLQLVDGELNNKK
jgi:selT/selW/selH-like putative selenoprotein